MASSRTLSFVLVVALAACAYAAYDQYISTVVLGPKQSYAISHEGPFDLTYKVTPYGGSISVYVMSDEDYDLFKEGDSFYYLADCSTLSSSYAEVNNFRVHEDGTYWVVMYNTQLLVTIDYDIKFDDSPKEELAVGFIIMIVLLCSCCLCTVCCCVRRMSKRRCAVSRCTKYEKVVDATELPMTQPLVTAAPTPAPAPAVPTQATYPPQYHQVYAPQQPYMSYPYPYYMPQQPQQPQQPQPMPVLVYPNSEL
jgi:hypothetical protein